MRFIAIALACAALLAFDTTQAVAAPPVPNDRSVSFEVKQANIREVFKILSQVAGKELAPDACVQGTIDMKMQNTPVSLVLDALASKLHLTYSDDGAVIHVGCDTSNGANAGAPAPKPVKELPRVTVSAKQVGLPELLEQIAKSSGFEGVDYQAEAKPKVDFTVQNVRFGTALAALADEGDVSIVIRNHKLVVTAR